MLSQIFSVTQGVCNHHVPLQYIIHNISARAVANILREIQQLLKKVQFFIIGDNNTQKTMSSNESRLIVEIADIIIYEGLSFNLSQKPRFKKVLDL